MEELQKDKKVADSRASTKTNICKFPIELFIDRQLLFLKHQREDLKSLTAIDGLMLKDYKKCLNLDF